MVKVLDIIIILFFLLISLFFFLNFKSAYDLNKKILIVSDYDYIYLPFVDNGTIDLSGKLFDMEGKMYNVYKGMLFEIKDGRIRAAHSDCANQICVNTSWIDKCNDMIVCVPNRVMLKIDCSGVEIK